MNTKITSKVAALGVALLMNSFLLGGVAYVFNTEAQLSTPTLSLADASAPAQAVAAAQPDVA